MVPESFWAVLQSGHESSGKHDGLRSRGCEASIRAQQTVEVGDGLDTPPRADAASLQYAVRHARDILGLLASGPRG
jgi:hypothetical protein